MSRLQQLTEMLKAEPHDSFLNYALALEHAKEKDFVAAIDRIEQLLQRDPNYLGAYYQLGKYYEQLTQHEKAMEVYKRGIDVAKRVKNKKAEGELNEALWMLEED